MNSQGQTICLNMIVKNEATVIRRCLDSVRPLIDRWIIVDTGSADGTQQIIREHLQDLPGELYERPWQDFAHNRSEALKLARDHGDYVLVIDADEVLEITPGFTLPELTCDSYNIEVRYGGCTYLRRQLVRNSLPWRYEGVVHEYITCEQARTEAFLPGVHTRPRHDGARARDDKTYRRDALILEKALLDDPENTRSVFYLAQSYRDAGDLELALRHYKHRAQMGGWREEVWYSLYQVALIEERMGHDWSAVMESYLTAFQYQPDRAGPLYRIGMHYQSKGEYFLSHLFFSRALKVPRPGPNRLFVEQTIYDYQIELEYGVACYYVGDHAEAIRANNSLLSSASLPPHAVDQVIRNRRFSLDALYPQTNSPASLPSIKVIVPFKDPGPSLDDCVDSIIKQESESFTATFLDYGSSENQETRVPLTDPRFSFAKSDQPDGWLALMEVLRRDRINTEEVVVLLSPSSQLTDKHTLLQIQKMFEDSACQLAYGQFRWHAGALGDAQPAPNEAAYFATGASLASHAAIAFRRSLISRHDPTDLESLFRASTLR